jgi:hypothetical protein
VFFFPPQTVLSGTEPIAMTLDRPLAFFAGDHLVLDFLDSTATPQGR